MTTAQEIEDWRVKIKKKIWSEFAAEPNEAHGKFLMKKFDELCDTALFGISINSQTTEGTDALEDEYFEAATKPDINIMIDVMRRALVLCRTYEQRMKVVEAETVEQRLSIAVAALKFYAKYAGAGHVAQEALAQIEEDKT